MADDRSIDTRFAATSGNPVDKRLDFCAYFLALIKTLDTRKETYGLAPAVIQIRPRWGIMLPI